MTATMELGLGTQLDPATIDITRHALERYLERRGQKPTVENWQHADERLRELLARCSGAPSRVDCTHGTPSRRYTAGGFVFIVSADHSTLITFYPSKRTGPTKPKKHGRRHG